MQLRLGLSLALSVFSLAGCSSMSINNGSLDYRQTTTLDPLQYPEGTMARAATPLYPAPIVDVLALENAPKLVNQRGNRYEMPRPHSESDRSTQDNDSSSDIIGKPQLLKDGNLNPLIKIDGNSATIWQYTLATLSSLNYSIANQSKNRYEVTIKVDKKTYVLKLSPVGASNNLAVLNADNSFADRESAEELLNQIYQNWPA